MRILKRPPFRPALILFTAVLLIAAISCAPTEAARPTAQPEATRGPVNSPTPERTTAPSAPSISPVEMPTAQSTASDPRAPSNFTPEQIEAATQRANCLKEQGIDPEVVRALARGEVTQISPELIAATNACNIKRPLLSEPQTGNPLNLSLTTEQTLCIYNSLGADVVAELIAGGNPTVGAFDPFAAFTDCGIDLNEILAAR